MKYFSLKFIGIVLVMFAMFSCEKGGGEHVHIFSDLETIEEGKFSAGEYTLSGCEMISTSKSFSGNNSVRNKKGQEFSLMVELSDVKKGDVIVASVWKKSIVNEGGIVIQDASEKPRQWLINRNIVSEKEGWQLVKTKMVALQDYETVKVYAFNNSEEYVYFDDISVDWYTNNQKPDDSFESLELTIPEQALDSIKMFRDIALEKGVIDKKLKTYFNANIQFQGEDIPVEIRLKGDWTDHLETDKWSYRIKVKGDKSILGLKTFSIQNPSTRSNMNEWFAHQILEKEDLLTTTYLFVPVIINNEKMGVFALEEHFDKQLLESRSRREGPIVKFDESGYWEAMNETDRSLDFFLNSADILPFKKNRTLKSENLLHQFNQAQKAMVKYREADSEIEKYLDFESMAKYIAITDIVDGEHGLIWHNQRFYFNGITQKLEPIGYDCVFFDLNYVERLDKRLRGAERFSRGSMTPIDALFENRKFNALYIKYLIEYTSDDFIQNLIAQKEKEIQEYEKLFQFEDPSFKFDRDFLLENVKKVRVLIDEYGTTKKASARTGDSELDSSAKKNDLLKSASLKVNIQAKSEETVDLLLRNYHLEEVEVIGYSLKSDKKKMISMPPVVLERYKTGTVDNKRITLPKLTKRIFFKAKNCGEEVFKMKLNKFSYPMTIPLKSNSKMPKIVQLKSKGYVISKGEHVVTSDIVIPEGSRFTIEAGAKINFIKGAGLISYSPVSIKGKLKDSVIIYSSDKSASGFTVMCNDEKCSMTYTRFDGFSANQKNGRLLTGAVTFYESDVTINNCNFFNNNSEDGVNFIRSEIELNSCVIKNTTSDGLDADFCKGSISYCKLINTGNDGLDFSGCQISIRNTDLIQIGDKGISGGERSIVNAENVKVDVAYIAIASKDDSKVVVSKLNVMKANTAFVCYQKKPEYGPATVTVTSVVKKNWQNFSMVEKGSQLDYIGEEFLGKKKFNIDSLYAIYEKK